MPRRAALAATLLLSLLAPAAGAATFTDSAGRRVELPDRVGRVFAAGPPASVTLFVLAPDKLAGWIREPSAEAKAYLPAAYAALPAVGRLTGADDAAGLEGVRRTAPDLIVDVGTVGPAYAETADRVQAATGVPYVLLDGGLARAPALLRELGGILGVGERAERLAAWSEAALADVAGRLAGLPAEARPAVYYGRGADGLETGGDGFVNLESLEAAGGTNVAGEIGRGWHAVTPEAVAGWRPALAAFPDAALAAEVAADPAWVPVVAAGARVVAAPALPFGWVEGPPGPNRLVGLHWLGRLLHPDRFPEPLGPRVREFHALFYGVELDDARLARLVGPGG